MVFRSTGSYEPDQYNEGEGVNLTSFDPQALTSLTRIHTAGPTALPSFDPQALTSLTSNEDYDTEWNDGFDPQALTSLTPERYPLIQPRSVSIHRLLRA